MDGTTGTTVGSIDTGVSGDNGAASAPSLPDFSALVPAEYKEELWVKDIARSDTPIKALFDQFKNAQSMIGKKGVEIPGEGATAEAIQAWHKALGVPDSPDKYEYKAPDISQLDENVRNILAEEAKDDSFMKTMRQVAQQAGLTPKQFKDMANAVDAWKVENAKSAVQAVAQQSEQRLAKFKEIYGDKADAVERNAKEVLKKVVPQNVIDTGDAELVLFEAMRYIHENVFKGDTVSGAQATGGFSGDSRQQIHNEIMKLRADPAFVDKFHPGYEGINAKVNELYKQMFSLNG